MTEFVEGTRQAQQDGGGAGEELVAEREGPESALQTLGGGIQGESPLVHEPVLERPHPVVRATLDGEIHVVEVSLGEAAPRQNGRGL